jgi:hypothetical protein
MCNFSPVWGWIAAVLAAVGGAVSSAFFGFAWMNAGPLAFLGHIGFFATAMWASLALLLNTSLSSSLSSYCACTSRFPSCASLCSTLTGLVAVLNMLLSMTLVVAGVLGFWSNRGLAVALFALVIALAGFAVAILAVAAALASCQPATTPGAPPGSGPTSPPVGTAPGG